MGQSPACPAVSSRDPAPRPASTAARGPGAPSAPGPSQGVVVRLSLHALDAVPAGPRSRGVRARTAARVHRHPPVDLPGGPKRWPARIFHPRFRTPSVPKWRNDAIPCARRSRRAPGSHAPATSFRPADAPGPRRRGCRRLRPYSGRHRPRPDRGRGGRWPGSPREPPRRVVCYAPSPSAVREKGA